MSGFYEISIFENISTSEVDKFCSGSIFLSQLWNIVLKSGAERSCAESESIVGIIDRIQEPIDVIFISYDSWQT
ncbi:hypothetical protein D3C86_2056290 [compost metagenome]